MIKLICLLLPATLSLKKETIKSIQNKGDALQFLLLYFKYLLLNVFSTFFVLMVAASEKGNTVFPSNPHASFVVQYLVVSSLLALYLPKILCLIKKNFSFKIWFKKVIK